MLYLLITVIIVYVAVPTYGMIRDMVGQGEAVFVLDSSLPDVQMNRPGRGIIEKIYDFLFPAKEVPVPVMQRIDLMGRVVYTDKSPYINGIIELKSEPRYTRTNTEGYFLFVDVEEGDHNLSVLDEAQNVLARCDVYIERDIEIKDTELTHLPDGTLLFKVAVDVKVLEVTLFLRHDDGGNVAGIERVEVGLVPPGTAAPLPPEPEIPPGPPVKPGEPPVSPVPPEEEEKPPGGGGGPPPPQPDKFSFDVFDTDTTVHYGRESAVNVNIFGTKKRIAPGMQGSYHFTVDNRANKYPSQYYVAFSDIDTLPAANKIPMLYRLKADGVFVAGDNNTWCTLPELTQDAIVAKGKQVKYTLDWYWPEGENDNEFARYAGNPDYSYSLIIKVTAQKQ